MNIKVRILFLSVAVIASALFFNNHTFAQSADKQPEFAAQLLIKANESYKNSDFHMAAEQYSRAIALGANNGHVHYNLGNVFFRLNQLGYAITEYRRALLDLPTNPDIKENLRLSRDKAIDDLGDSSHIIQAIGLSTLMWPHSQFNLYELRQIGMLLYVAFWLLVIMQVTYNKQWVRWLIGITGICGLLLSVSLFCTRYGRTGEPVFAFTPAQHSISPAVIVASEASIYSGNAEHFQVVFILHSGAEIEATERRDNWLAVRLPNGKRGWVKSIDVEII